MDSTTNKKVGNREEMKRKSPSPEQDEESSSEGKESEEDNLQLDSSVKAPSDTAATAAVSSIGTKPKPASKDFDRKALEQAKRANRLAMNRESARARRRRKKIKLESLEQRTGRLQQENELLAAANEALLIRVAELERELAASRNALNTLQQRTTGGRGGWGLPSPSNSASASRATAGTSPVAAAPLIDRSDANVRLKLATNRATLLAAATNRRSQTETSRQGVLNPDWGSNLVSGKQTALPSNRTSTAETLAHGGNNWLGSTANSGTQRGSDIGAGSVSVSGSHLGNSYLDILTRERLRSSARPELSELQYVQLLSEARSRAVTTDSNTQSLHGDFGNARMDVAENIRALMRNQQHWTSPVARSAASSSLALQETPTRQITLVSAFACYK